MKQDLIFMTKIFLLVAPLAVFAALHIALVVEPPQNEVYLEVYGMEDWDDED